MQDVNNFKNDCLNLSSELVVQKHLIDGDSYYFREVIESEREFDFKKRVSKPLDVHIRDIAIVGSGKLGFSIKPDIQIAGFYPFKEFDYAFKRNKNEKKSDLDIAIISSRLFEKQLINIYEYTQGYKNQIEKRNGLGKYILKGWLRPDMIPDDYKINENLDEIILDLEEEYNRSVNIGIYKSWYYFEAYHSLNIQSIKLNLISSNGA